MATLRVRHGRLIEITHGLILGNSIWLLAGVLEASAPSVTV